MKGILYLIGFVSGIIIGLEAKGNSMAEKIKSISNMIKFFIFRNFAEKEEKPHNKIKKRRRRYRNYIVNRNLRNKRRRKS